MSRNWAGMQPPAVDDAAADVVDDLAQGRAHRDLDEAGVDDPSGQGEDLGALALPDADVRVPLRTVAQDRWHVGVRLDVVDQRGAVPQARYRRVRRPGPRRAAAALDGCDQGGFL